MQLADLQAAGRAQEGAAPADDRDRGPLPARTCDARPDRYAGHHPHAQRPRALGRDQVRPDRAGHRRRDASGSYETDRIHLLFNGDFYGLSDFLYRAAQPRRGARRQARRERTALQRRHGDVQRARGLVPEDLRRAVRQRLRLRLGSAAAAGRADDTTDGTTTTRRPRPLLPPRPTRRPPARQLPGRPRN